MKRPSKVRRMGAFSACYIDFVFSTARKRSSTIPVTSGPGAGAEHEIPSTLRVMMRLILRRREMMDASQLVAWEASAGDNPWKHGEAVS